MIKFYYRTGIISGLAVTISTSTAFLLLNHNFYSMVITLFSLILGGSVAKSAYDFFSFRLWTCLYSLMSCYGAFLAIYWHDEALSYVGFVLIGLTAGGFLFILPPNLMITWFGQSKSFMLGSLWSISTLFGVSLRILIKIFPYMI